MRRSSTWLPKGLTVSRTDSWLWKPERARETLLQHFAVQSLDGFGLAEQRMALQAAGALLAYLGDTQRSALVQITAIHTYSASGFMELDLQARRNLELAESARGEKRHGLLAVLDETRTPMGGRLLRRWLGQPLLDLETIHRRQDAVRALRRRCARARRHPASAEQDRRHRAPGKPCAHRRDRTA